MTFDGSSRPSLTELDEDLRVRLLALDEPVTWVDWAGVLARSRSSSRWNRRAATFGVVAAGLAVALAAAVVAGLHSFASNGAAPPVWQNFSDLALAPSPPSVPAQAIASETRIVTSASLGDGKHTLYVSPAKNGGFCFEWTGGAGGCDELASTPLSVTWARGRLVGTVSAAQVSSVRIEFTDGTSDWPHITWVSAPINAGFFLYDIPSGKTIARVDGFDAGRQQGQITWFSV